MGGAHSGLMNHDTPQPTSSNSPSKRPPVRVLTWVVLGVAVLALAAVLIPRPVPVAEFSPNVQRSARIANGKEAAEMQAQIAKVAANQKPPLDAQRFLALVREASEQSGKDNMASVNAGKEAIELLDGSKDAEHGVLYKAEIALVVARSAKASGDRADQDAFMSIGMKAFNEVMSDPHATPAQKKQASDDLAKLKELGP